MAKNNEALMGNAENKKPTGAVGFLTVVDHPQFGLFGGYLILNRAGRPLEFHCTAPIKPNRAQQILYGRTLDDFLYGEQIGRTLVAHAKCQPALVCTDRMPALAVREHIVMPVAMILPPEGEGSGGCVVEFQLGRNRVGLATMAAGDRQVVTERLAELGESFDLSEPFARIREAIEEAQQGVGRAA